MSILLGIAAALLIGLSDLFGRASSRRDQSSVTHVITQMIIGTLVLLPFTLIIESSFITRDAIFGALSGLTVAVGLSILYRAAADSSSAVTVPLSAVVAILVPLTFDFARGADIPLFAGVGCAVAILSIVLVSFDPNLGTDQLRRSLGLATVGGLFLGLTFLFAGVTSEESGAWPAVFNRTFGLIGILPVALAQGTPLLLSPSVRKFGILGGVAGGLGMLAVVIGTQIGSLGIVSVLAGASPVVTVLGSAIFDDNTVSPTQLLGIAGAIAGTAIIALAS